jgi:hypothetical protein
MLIENRLGASTIIGTEAASRAAPNGATVLIIDPSFLNQPAFAKSELRSREGFRADLPPR